MFPRTKSLFTIIILYLALIQGIAGQSDDLPASQSTHQSDCTSDQIQKGDVKNCMCHGSDHQCDNKCPATPPGLKCVTAQESQVYLQDCAASCAGEHNHCCSGCWIWFQEVCSCLQNGGCPKGNTPSVYWLKVNSQLASTNVLIPNILNLQTSQPALAIDVWNFGQQIASDPKKQALAINSAHSITENQIHMHICGPNINMQQTLADLYNGHSSPAFYSTLRDIPSPPLTPPSRMFCRAAQTKFQLIPGATISDDINTVLKRPDTCNYYVGAAVIIDKNNYIWSCVTADHESTEVKRFCA